MIMIIMISTATTTNKNNTINKNNNNTDNDNDNNTDNGDNDNYFTTTGDRRLGRERPGRAGAAAAVLRGGDAEEGATTNYKRFVIV